MGRFETVFTSLVQDASRFLRVFFEGSSGIFLVPGSLLEDSGRYCGILKDSRGSSVIVLALEAFDGSI